MGLHSDQGALAVAPAVPRHRHAAPAGRSRAGLVPSGPWLTGLAYLVVAVPFVIAVVRLLATPSAHLTLPDDLALIDLHTRRALAWQQQLGVFDHNNWNHPGPAYFYWLALVYRVLGSGTRSLFVGATLVNGLAAAACVAVVRRRTSPGRALWAAVWVCVLGIVLAAAGPASTTYSESVLGAFVSPWNPTVVLFPLLLVLLLCAGAVDRSGTSLVGALLVASFVVQTDISTLPVAAALVVVAGVVWLVALARSRRLPDHPASVRSPWAAGLVVAGLVLLVVMWLPPLIQQVTGHPGNLTLLWRFFTASHPGQSLSGSLWAVAAAGAVVVVGPGEVMRAILGGTPTHAVVAVVVAVITLLVGAATVYLGARDRARFAAGIGVLVLVGWVASVVAVSHVVGFIFGYLVLWVVVLPVAAAIGIGTVRVPVPAVPPSVVRIGLCGAAVVAGVVLSVRVLAIPSLTEAADPVVGHLAALIEPHLVPQGQVMVGDAGAGTTGSDGTQLLDTEEFFGLVNLLDQRGHHPTVSPFWKAEVGPWFVTTGHEDRWVTLATWTPASPGRDGYVGKAGDMAVFVTDRAPPLARAPG